MERGRSGVELGSERRRSSHESTALIEALWSESGGERELPRLAYTAPALVSVLWLIRPRARVRVRIILWLAGVQRLH